MNIGLMQSLMICVLALAGGSREEACWDLREVPTV